MDTFKPAPLAVYYSGDGKTWSRIAGARDLEGVREMIQERSDSAAKLAPLIGKAKPVQYRVFRATGWEEIPLV